MKNAWEKWCYISGRVIDKNNEESEEELASIATKETDKQFQRFRTRIKSDPNQVIRYERDGEPLWVSSQNKPQEIPPCKKCGKPRQFEFQVNYNIFFLIKLKLFYWVFCVIGI